MKSSPRLLVLAAVSALLGAGLYLGCRSDPLDPAKPVKPRPALDSSAPVSPSLVSPSETRWHDGAAWKTGIWARDEMQLLLAPGAAAPEGAFARSDGEAGVKIPPAADRAAFVARAKELERRGGVKEARPDFYATPEALEKRSLAGRMILTRQVAVTLPEGAAPEAVAARHGARVLSKLEFLARTWLFEAAGPFDALDVAAALRERDGIAFAAPQFAMDRGRKRRVDPDDDLFLSQWHLRNTGQSGGTAGQDINVVGVWDTLKGDGVVIGIVDDGLERTPLDHVSD